MGNGIGVNEEKQIKIRFLPMILVMGPTGDEDKNNIVLFFFLILCIFLNVNEFRE